MGRNKWTDEQLTAISRDGCDLLVAAAAGAGKTAVLVERIIRKITGENPIDIDRLLVVTFTNAAATEMRERIGKALEEELEAHPESALLQKQMALLDKASITTIHSFCLEVVRSNFHRIDLDPGFRIADETETTLMKLDILEELFEAKYDDDHTGEEFYALVDSYGGGRSDEGLQTIVLDLFEFIRSSPWPQEWLEVHTAEYKLKDSLELFETNWVKVLLDTIAVELEGVRRANIAAKEEAASANGLGSYVACLDDDLHQLDMLVESLKNGGSWDRVQNAFSCFEPSRLPKCGKDADTEAQERVKKARGNMRDCIRKICSGVFNTGSQEIIADLEKLYPLLECLSALALEFGKMYSARKKEKGVLDFNDLEHMCLSILMDNGEETQVAESLMERYVEIMIDEYQDSNLIQEVILNSISRRKSGQPNVFMVGDVKQSIYRFRQAKPELFLQKYNSYPASDGQDSMLVRLFKNFRSRGEIINGVNYVFRQIMSVLAGELDYTEEEALYTGAVYPPAEEVGPLDGKVSVVPDIGGPVELNLVDMTGGSMTEGSMTSVSMTGGSMTGSDTTEGEEAGDDGTTVINDSDDDEPLDVIQAEAGMVAGRILQLLGNDLDGHKRPTMVYDSSIGGYRGVELRDIVILLRTTRNWAGVFAEELALMGIPAYADAGSGYFKTLEVQTVMSLLQIIDNPLQDIPLLAVLRSPIGSFSPDELTDIRLADRDATFYNAMKRFVEVNEDEIKDETKDEIEGETKDEIEGETKDEIEGVNENPLRIKTSDFLGRLEKWRDKSLCTPVDELIWYLFSDTSYYSYSGILPGGGQRQANLKMLFERARQYEKTSYKGLFNFVNFIDRLKSGGGDLGSAKILGENENVVRIMSIHKSKGLEFPVVFVSGCGKRFNMQDMNGKILLHQDLGFGPDIVDCVRRITWPLMPKQAIRYKLKLETLSEEMRILYVAMTRAKEKLIITAAPRNLKGSVKGWAGVVAAADGKIPEYEVLRGTCYLDWLGPAITRHRDGGAIRDIATVAERDKMAGAIVEDPSGWKVNIWDISDIKEGRRTETDIGKNLALWSEKEQPDKEPNTEPDADYEFVRSRLEWSYPYKNTVELPAKLTVTELKRRFAIIDTAENGSKEAYKRPVADKPAFMQGKRGFSAAEKGTLLHFAMQHYKLDEIRECISRCNQPDRELRVEIVRQLMAMVDEEILTGIEADVIDAGRIVAFFLSDIGARLLASKEVQREIPFTLGLRSSELFPALVDVSSATDEIIMLQGVIDCCFVEDGGVVLLDYKTDYVDEGGSHAVAERYRLQLDYYARALESITGRIVKGKYIYLFHSSETIGL